MSAHQLSQYDNTISQQSSFRSRRRVNTRICILLTNGDIKCIYEEQFMIVQDFRSLDDKGGINALNMNYNSSPLILELKMSKPDASSTATLVNTYLELSSEIVVKYIYIL
jgi:hypothetical protein